MENCPVAATPVREPPRPTTKDSPPQGNGNVTMRRSKRGTGSARGARGRAPISAATFEAPVSALAGDGASERGKVLDWQGAEPDTRPAPATRGTGPGSVRPQGSSGAGGLPLQEVNYRVS